MNKQCMRIWVATLIAALFGGRTTAARAGDVSSAGITKNLNYTETAYGTPVLSGGQFFAFADLTAPGDATGANLSGAATATLTPNTAGGQYSYLAQFSNQADLDAAFPNGSYTLTIHTVDNGDQAVPLSLAGGYFPPVPHITGTYLGTPGTLVVQIDPIAGLSRGTPLFVQVALSGGASPLIGGTEIPDAFSAFATTPPGQPWVVNVPAFSNNEPYPLGVPLEVSVLLQVGTDSANPFGYPFGVGAQLNTGTDMTVVLPTPEPASLALFATGLVPLLRRRRRVTR